jgi:hypothetical protein
MSDIDKPPGGILNTPIYMIELQLAFPTMTNIRHFWVASNSRQPMQTIKTMWKAIFQNKLTIYKANLPSFVQKNL